ncbi:MAG: hypothetical protein K8R76_02125 [Candidatus Aegiribacteria sp.]|nr:hypothetical protein [Candidatus Aegiribacteria sp.]
MQVISHFLLIFLVFINSSAQILDETDSIDIPPGGYAWSIYNDTSVSQVFTTVSTFAPGPWPGIDDQQLREFLTEPALEALDLADEWLIHDLLVKFADLLFEPVDVSSPVQPAFADVNSDASSDLILTDDDGDIHAYVAPNWEEFQSPIEEFDFQVLCDINNDGLADTALISSDGTLTIESGGLPFLTASGFDFSAVTGVALSDMEGDGLADLIAGTESGKVLVFRNRGTVETPVFLPFSSESELFFPMNPGAFTIPEIYSVDDTTMCLAAGTQQSGLKLYRLNIDSQVYADEWVEIESVLSSEKLQNISPVVICLDGETKLICCSRYGALYEVISDPDSLQMLSLPPVPGTYPSLAYGCLNGDLEPDLVAGTMEGDVFMLRGYRNGWFEGSWERIPDFPAISSGTPAFFEDGIIFGSKDGDIRYYVRTEEETWTDVTDISPFRGIDVGEYSSPCTADFNSDGVDELIIGNSSGNLTCFELDENACNGEPFFIEKHSFRFAPNRAVSELNRYYSRYFSPYSLLRTPSDSMIVNAFAREVIEADPLIRDEIAYCVANTPTEILREMYENGDSDIFSNNALQLYSLANELEYVRLTESTDGTICELLIDSGWVTIKRENYYRFVVHPRILFEVPGRIDADYWLTDADSLELTMEEWLRHEPDSLFGESENHVFWRETIPSDHSHGPVLIQSMRKARTYEEAVLRICNYLAWSQPNGIMTFGYLTNDLQPMVIYRKGYGSCGEQSILQTALCRAFFIPAYVVGCRGEDHQWNHYLNPSDGRWNHWDINYGIRGIGHVWVSGEGNAHSRKTISAITAFGPEDTVWPVTRSVAVPEGSGYMPGDSGYTATAHVEVMVSDARGTPVEGAMVLMRSHWDRANMVSIFNYTNEMGKCSFELGWEPYGGYTLDIVTPYGVTGCSNISFSEGKDYTLEYSVPGTIPDMQEILLPENAPSDGIHASAVLYPVSYYTGTLYSLDNEEDNGGYGGTRWTEWPESHSSAIPVFMDGENFRNYANGFNCRALPAPFRSEPGDTCFVVLDNRNNLFTWRRFSGMETYRALSSDLPPVDTAWLNAPVPIRIPGVSPVPEYAFSDSSSGQNWIKLFSEVQIEQDDPDDPLSAGWILGPFRLPANERSLSIGTTGITPDLDMDLFLFKDQNSNRLVDGMSEVAESSSSPTSNENIFIPDPDTSAVYWIYMQGWQVPDETGKVDLGLAFEPEMLRIHSLEPSGCLDSIPERFSFEIEPEMMENERMLVLFGEASVIPRLVNEKLVFDRPSQCSKSEIPELSILDENGELIERVFWTVQTDSTPPVISEYSVSMDSTLMFAHITVKCIDEDTGILNATLSAEGLDDAVLIMGEDSIWTVDLNLTQVSAQPVAIILSFEDMAGNEKVSEPYIITVPERPLALFHSEYPGGTTYDHRPILQICVDFSDSILTWEARAELSDSSGDVMYVLSPLAMYEDLVQFRPPSYLDDGEYSISITFLSCDGEELAGYSWSFTVDRMDTPETGLER